MSAAMDDAEHDTHNIVHDAAQQGSETAESGEQQYVLRHRVGEFTQDSIWPRRVRKSPMGPLRKKPGRPAGSEALLGAVFGWSSGWLSAVTAPLLCPVAAPVGVALISGGDAPCSGHQAAVNACA